MMYTNHGNIRVIRALKKKNCYFTQANKQTDPHRKTVELYNK